MKKDFNLNIDSELDAQKVYELEENIKGIKIQYAIPQNVKPKGIYKVKGLNASADKCTFMLSKHNILDPGEYTVTQYFEMGKKYKIRYPHLPCLKITRNITIPIEICTVVSEYLTLKCLHSNINVGITNHIQNPFLKEFGVHVDKKMAIVPAKVLEEPTLTYAHNMISKPISGNWKAHNLAESAVLKSWAIVHLNSGTLTPDHIKRFHTEFLLSAQNLNVAVNAANQVLTCNIKETKYKTSEMKNMIFNAITTCRNHNIRLVVVIIPSKIPKLYEFVKQTAELDVGILTQCVKDDTLKKSMMFAMRNLLLKINSKLDGVNHKLANYSLSMMGGAIIFGGYITNKSNGPKQLVEAAVAATQNLDGTKYNMEWRLQPIQERYICDLEDMAHRQLLKYAANTGRLPTKVIFYRDGKDVKGLGDAAEEVSMVRRACLRIDTEYRPPINYILVQKRCQTRVYSLDDAGRDHSESITVGGLDAPKSITKFGIVPTGTVVDTHIVGQHESYFYLCSKAGKQLSTMPTKYYPVCNDSDFTKAQLEQITFDLCYMSLHGTNSTAHPAAVRYARLAAKRAQIYRKRDDSSASASKGSMAEEDIQFMAESKMTNKCTMYFL